MSIATDFDLPGHPLDVKPEGNAYLASCKAESPLSCLPDELIVHILEYLDPVSLGRLGASCKHLRAFSRFDELWKTHCVLTPPSNLTWRGSWFSTFTGHSLAPVSCEGVFSDTLYRPFLCANTPLQSYSSNIPKRNEIDRLGNLTEDDFQDRWTNRPFILTDLVKRWPLTSSWSENGLTQSFAETVFRAECVDWPMKTYFDYMSNTLDESPLYLFDRAFVEKMNLKVDGKMSHSDYWVPDCFGDDFFAVLGDQRPDYRWLIIGPERSGSTFHKDPNGTSAWNAVITGSKYWIMFPSGPNVPPPPGVFASSDQSEVTTPASIAEWLLGFHEEARQIPGCIEGICRAGEMLHVPSGWWHLVVNLEPSIALTQNFVPKAHLHKVLLFLRDQKQAVSGFRSTVDDPYGLFVDRMAQRYPEELQEALEAISRGKKRVWTELTENAEGSAENERSGFTFGFADYDSDDSVP